VESDAKEAWAAPIAAFGLGCMTVLENDGF
jgi:hypothetical protein